MRIQVKRILFCMMILVTGSWMTASAQAKAKTRKTIRGEFQLPRAFSNRAFTKTFSGVFNAGVSMNFSGKHFTVGPFYSLMQFQIFPKLFDDPHCVQTTHTGGIRFAWDNLTKTGNGMWSPFISPGFTHIDYTRLKYKTTPPTVTKYNTFSVNAGITYNIMIDEYTGAGFIMGYNFVNHIFDPKATAIDQFYNFDPGDEAGETHHLFFGFSVYFDLAKRPEGGGSGGVGNAGE